MRMTHIPYRGTGQSVNALLAGDVDVNIDTLATYLPHIRGGRMRALATTLPQRATALPEVPTVEEQGFPGYDMSVWYMVLGPAGLPEAVVRRWEAALGRTIADPVINRRLVESGYIPGGGGAAEAAALVRRDAERLGRVVEMAGVRLEWAPGPGLPACGAMREGAGRAGPGRWRMRTREGRIRGRCRSCMPREMPGCGREAIATKARPMS